MVGKELVSMKLCTLTYEAQTLQGGCVYIRLVQTPSLGIHTE